MFTITVKSRKGDNTYNIFENVEEFNQFFLPGKGAYIPFDKSKVSMPDVKNYIEVVYKQVYVEDKNGLIAPIIKRPQMMQARVRGTSQRHYSIVTPFGMDMLCTLYSGFETVIKWKDLDFKRPRANFHSLAKTNVHSLNAKARGWLRDVMNGQDFYGSYTKWYGTEVMNITQKYAIAARFRSILMNEECVGIMSIILKEMMKSRGVGDPQWFLQKMLNSIEGPIKTSVQLEIFRLIGAATEDEDIKLLVGANTTERIDDDRGRINLPTTDAEVLETEAPKEKLLT